MLIDIQKAVRQIEYFNKELVCSFSIYCKKTVKMTNVFMVSFFFYSFSKALLFFLHDIFAILLAGFRCAALHLLDSVFRGRVRLFLGPSVRPSVGPSVGP